MSSSKYKYHLTFSTPLGLPALTSIRYKLLLIFITLTPLFTVAQPSGYAGSFSRIGFGPRGIAMGNALTASHAEGVYAYYNPALAAFAEQGSQIDLSTSLMSFDRTLNSLNTSFRLPPSAGLNISLLNANVKGIDGRTSSGYYTSELKTGEYQLLTSFGITITSSLAVGVGVKFNLADYHPEVSPARGVAFDIGAIYQVSEKLTLGVASRDLLASYSWNSSDLYGEESLSETNETFPVRINLGAAYQLNSLHIAASYAHLIHDEEQFEQVKVGFSWPIHERISLRGGWQIDDLKNIIDAHRPGAGFSIHLPFDILEPSVDYAYLKEPNSVSSMHVFGLRMNL